MKKICCAIVVFGCLCSSALALAAPEAHSPSLSVSSSHTNQTTGGATERVYSRVTRTPGRELGTVIVKQKQYRVTTRVESVGAAKRVNAIYDEPGPVASEPTPLSTQMYAENLDTLKTVFMGNKPAEPMTTAWQNVGSASELPPAIRAVYERLPYDAAGGFHRMLKVEVLASWAPRATLRLNPADHLYIAEYRKSVEENVIQILAPDGVVVASGRRELHKNDSVVRWDAPIANVRRTASPEARASKSTSAP